MGWGEDFIQWKQLNCEATLLWDSSGMKQQLKWPWLYTTSSSVTALAGEIVFNGNKVCSVEVEVKLAYTEETAHWSLIGPFLCE